MEHGGRGTFIKEKQTYLKNKYNSTNNHGDSSKYVHIPLYARGQSM